MRIGGLGLFFVFSLFAQMGALSVSHVRAEAVSHSSVQLIWDNSAPINAIRIRYGLTASYEFGPGGGIHTPYTRQFLQYGQTASLSGLEPDSHYYFCPQSSSDGGKTWSACGTVEVKTLPLPAIHPAAPQPPAGFDVRYPAQSGAELMASADCSNLQELLNQARYGDTILIPAGATCSDRYELPRAPEAQLFRPEDVDTQLDQITLAGHPFADGQHVRLDSEICLPGSAGEDVFCATRGLLPGSDALVERVDDRHIRLRKPDGTPFLFAISTFSLDASTGTLTIPPDGPKLRDGSAIQVRSTGALPGGLQPRRTYYVLNPSRTRSVKLALTPGGSPIPIADAGQGTHSFADPGAGASAIMAWPPEDKWIVVRTATPDSEFCPEGVRCLGEFWASRMARIAQMTPPTNSHRDLRLLAGLLSHHWRFTGIEFTHADNSAAAETTSDPLPYYGFISTRRASSHIVLDRCYIHGLGAPNRIYRAIETFDGSYMAIVDSDLEKLDFWHPSVSPLGAFTPTIKNPQTVQVAPGTFHTGTKSAVLPEPATIILTGGSGSGRAIVYFDMDGRLHVDLPPGVTGSCGESCVMTTSGTPNLQYPVNAAGQLSGVQITDLTIANGAFVSTAYRANYPQAARSEGAQSFIAGHGPGPFLIQNNTISGTGIPMHFDDSGGKSEDRHDYVVRRNLFTAPLSQLPGAPQSDGLHYFHRNMLEWKGGQRILVEGNVFEHNFADVTPIGPPLVITPVGGGRVTDVMIRNNTFRHNGGGIMLAAVDTGTPNSKPLERVAIVNNLFHNNDGRAFAVTTFRPQSTGIQLLMGYAAEDVRIDHNTFYDNRGTSPQILHWVLNPAEGVAVTNNFWWVNGDRNGISGEAGNTNQCSAPDGLGLLDCFLKSGDRPNYIFARNIILPGRPAEPASPAAVLNSNVLRGVFSRMPDNWVIDGSGIDERLANAGLTNAEDPFRMTGDSLYSASGSRSGTDGKAIGADIDQLEVAQGRIGAPSVAVDGLAATITVRVPDPDEACYVFYGTGTDLANFARTPADLSGTRVRAMRIDGLQPATQYLFAVFCSGASNAGAGGFVTPE